MKKIFVIIAALLLGAFFTSCTSYKIIPKAINTVNSVGLSELNLKHGSDYTIMNTTTAEATVYYSESVGRISICEENNEFEIIYTEDKKTGKWSISSCKGIARFGFLSNDYGFPMTQRCFNASQHFSGKKKRDINLDLLNPRRPLNTLRGRELCRRLNVSSCST